MLKGTPGVIVGVGSTVLLGPDCADVVVVGANNGVEDAEATDELARGATMTVKRLV